MFHDARGTRLGRMIYVMNFTGNPNFNLGVNFL